MNGHKPMFAQDPQAKIGLRMNLSLPEMLMGNAPLGDLANLR